MKFIYKLKKHFTIKRIVYISIAIIMGFLLRQIFTEIFPMICKLPESIQHLIDSICAAPVLIAAIIYEHLLFSLPLGAGGTEIVNPSGEENLGGRGRKRGYSSSSEEGGRKKPNLGGKNTPSPPSSPPSSPSSSDISEFEGEPASPNSMNGIEQDIINSNASNDPQHHVPDPAGTSSNRYVPGIGVLDSSSASDISQDSALGETEDTFQPFATNLADYLDAYRTGPNRHNTGVLGFPRMNESALR